jgi:anti-sigma regulatory factor (Ser/Thr protein kinase)
VSAGRVSEDEPRLESAWPAVPESVALLRRAISRFAVACDATDGSAVVLAVSEAATNAVVHAYVGRPPGTISIEAFCDAAHLVIVVADDGLGTRPRPDSPGLGLGLPLMSRLAASVEFATGPAGGTVVCLRFPRRV